ncbi:hypothetical protein K1719_015446 [Acacia pycnantha]|nr:hypothetical protein K1719_015446 [Acacia pycnantha]
MASNGKHVHNSPNHIIILTSPKATPTLHSQFFISHQIPCYLNWDYPPILCPKPLIIFFSDGLPLQKRLFNNVNLMIPVLLPINLLLPSLLRNRFPSMD